MSSHQVAHTHTHATSHHSDRSPMADGCRRRLGGAHVIQDYFTKWAHVIPMPNQTAPTITAELVKVFSMFGLPDILHFDQGRNFESALLRETLDSVGVKISRTTAYHPQGDEMVEMFNRSLLQMLQVYVQDQADWEHYLPLVLFPYRTAVHSSTRFSPFELMFSRLALTSPLPYLNAFDVNTYHFQLHSTLARLYKSLWRCTSPRQLTTRRHSMIIMCMNVHSRLATVSGCLSLLQGSWNQAGRKVGDQIHQKTQLLRDW